MKSLFASALMASYAAANSDYFAILVAGSSGFWNYRHQADIHHAYNIMIENGIPAENIVVFAVDDIANNPSNPFPGQIFNKPDGENVYNPKIIDYKGIDVTPEKFLAVLTGNGEAAGGKTLKTGPKSKIFVNFSDHGAPGLIAFPYSYLYADAL